MARRDSILCETHDDDLIIQLYVKQSISVVQQTNKNKKV